MLILKPEILAPVGNEEMLTAAVRAGADAVYMGMQNFNARRNADNFSNGQFADAVKYCRKNGVKVYLTLNTVVSDEEMNDALAAAKTAYLCGIDAVIVQDIGLASLLHKHIPALPLHASTQLTAHSPSAVDFLKKLGFSRVVVSREMSKAELSEFCKKAKENNMSVEVFVHGALCMSMSGQCLLSAMLGGRSGNRGLCAGPCRLPFKCEGGTGFDLSLKDLSLIDRLEELKALGVDSFKIEGRMKRPEYVAAAVSVCRKALDGEDYSKDYETLKKVFSRNGFTSGYFDGTLGKDMFGIRTRDDVAITATVLSSLHNIYRNEYQRIEIFGKFTLPPPSLPAVLTVSDGENEVVIKGALSQEAKSRPADREFLAGKLLKTGGTPYYFKNLDIEIAENSAISGGEVNAMRREALCELSKKREASDREDFYIPDISTSPNKTRIPKLLARFSSISQIPDDLSQIHGVILPLESDFENVKLDIPLAVDIPRGIKNEGEIEKRLKTAYSFGIRYAFCGNIAAVILAQKCGLYPVFDFSMNIYNSNSAVCAKDLGAHALCVSAELKSGYINKLYSPIPTILFGYGRLPLMLTRNCPLKNGVGCKNCPGGIYDRMGIFFPVKCREGYFEVFNSRPIFLADRKDEFSADYMMLYFTTETKAECEKIISAYVEGKAPECEYTRGLYYRGTL